MARKLNDNVFAGTEELASGTLETGFPLFSGRKIMLKRGEQREKQKCNHCVVKIIGTKNVLVAQRDNF